MEMGTSALDLSVKKCSQDELYIHIGVAEVASWAKQKASES